jgi:nicotinate-nucleotide adenylyltransferase
MRIGILGGTFNPVHSAHVQMARIARDEAALDRVLLVVAADPPHKSVEGEVPADERFKMVSLAVENEAGVEASDMEIKRGGTSYMLLTLQELNTQYPKAELLLIVGSDTLHDLPNWHRPQEVLKLAGVLCVPRIGLDQNDEKAACELNERFGAKVTILSGKADMISSTDVRDRLEAGRSVDGLLPDAVEQACYESGAYFPAEVRALQKKCRAALSKERYRHVAGTMRAAAALAERWNQDPEKARVAALLHDCAKCLDPVMQAVLSGDDSDVVAVYHAFAGAVLAKTEYGVTDEQILRAIRLHTTGDAGMTDFDATIYAADLIEPTRTFSCVDAYRQRVSLGPDAFMRYALRRVVRFIGRSDKALHPATRRATKYYDAKQSNKKKMEGSH